VTIGPAGDEPEYVHPESEGSSDPATGGRDGNGSAVDGTSGGDSPDDETSSDTGSWADGGSEKPPDNNGSGIAAPRDDASGDADRAAGSDPIVSAPPASTPAAGRPDSPEAGPGAASAGPPRSRSAGPASAESPTGDNEDDVDSDDDVDNDDEDNDDSEDDEDNPASPDVTPARVSCRPAPATPEPADFATDSRSGRSPLTAAPPNSPSTSAAAPRNRPPC
jgi:hypothetical protein